MSDPVGEYIAKTLSRLRAVPPGAHAGAGDPEVVAGDIFAILTGREFCYLGRTRTDPYRAGAVALMAAQIRRAEPVSFYYDIGPGYHASVTPDETGLVFHVGFSELCVLAQVASFCNRVAQVHPPGAKFFLVIDNVCALVTNDIPLAKTTSYCAELRRLIEETGTGDRVSLLVESEVFDAAGYVLDRARIAREIATLEFSREDVENVGRFLGRRCDDAEAAERIVRYRQAGEMTESRLAGVVRGVRMTQRATPGTLGFRPFPGGDSRTQVGEVAIGPNAKGEMRPFLLTSRNVAAYRCTRRQYPDLLPPVIRHVTCAEPVGAAPASG